ncbi:ETO1-like protein 1 isoform X2 [Spinacia oleracea]|uniref:ETO1-like protein 1 isoform X2 n=1 Tax=Spinacia oleracea TaxID=3562 RepID=A0A9R0JQL9_SPIOL|nr:ETO1-like protein 1 isoform X2 [Spinacia oleracea]
MRTIFNSESCKETLHLNVLNPQSWLQVERGKFSKVAAAQASSSIGSLVKVPEPPIVAHFKPLDYVQVLAQIHEELESCPLNERSSLYLLQFQVFRGLGEVKLMRRSLRTAWLKASSVHEKIIFGAWLKYEKKGEDFVFDLLGSCSKCARETGPIDVASELQINSTSSRSSEEASISGNESDDSVVFRIGNERVNCDRQKMANLSSPFCAMLNGCFTESYCEEIDFSENNISVNGMREISDFSKTGCLNEVSPDLLVEMLIFANKFCCESLKDTCDRKLASLVSTRQDAVDLLECAIEENSPILAASCLQVFLHDLPDCLNDDRVVEILGNANGEQLSIVVGQASFSLFSLLSEVSMSLDASSDITVLFLERLVQSAKNNRQKMLAFHQLGCARLLRKEYDEAEELFQKAVKEGHTYSIAGLARISYNKGKKSWAFEKLNSLVLSSTPLGWMYQERSLYYEGDKRWDDLEKATDLDPTLTYPYMYRAASLMRKQEAEAAIGEINRVLGFKLALECLELRFCFYLALENYEAAFCDVQAILTLSPGYRMFEGRVAATKLRMLVREHVENWTTADCWLKLYDRWSSVDDIGSLSVIYQMLESDAAKGVLYFRQSLLLLRLNCPEAAMRSLQLARQHASSEDERLVYEGWILYDTGHCEEGLRKAEESIKLKRSFEAFFLKAYALADSSQDPTCSSAVITLLEDALKCPSDRLRKGSEQSRERLCRLWEIRLSS